METRAGVRVRGGVLEEVFGRLEDACGGVGLLGPEATHGAEHGTVYDTPRVTKGRYPI